ncbi:MAG: hypothetical protein K8R87_08340 [Verrucomicrobia bacterium]|nr:hypothetical protein [Verrucomicrobiota bacterium]
MAAKKKSAKVAKSKTKKTSAAAARYVDELVMRGEAVEKKSAGQKLPPGATHWLIVNKETGERSVVRGRFSLI